MHPNRLNFVPQQDNSDVVDEVDDTFQGVEI